MKIKKRHVLRSDKIKEYTSLLKNQLDNCFLEEIDNTSKWETIETKEDFKILLIDSIPSYIILNDLIIPHIKIITNISEKYITVDQGAIKHVCNGADIMYPGIVDRDENIKKNDIVSILEEKHKKVLAVGRALVDGTDINKTKKGKAIVNLHYVGDKYWNVFKA